MTKWEWAALIAYAVFFILIGVLGTLFFQMWRFEHELELDAKEQNDAFAGR